MFPSSISNLAAMWSATIVTVGAALAQSDVSVPAGLVDSTTPITARLFPDGTDAGVWASGRNYKASFHDGFVFYPHVGADLPHQPVQWRTARVQIGNRELSLSNEGDVSPYPTWTDDVCQYDLGAIVERYEVRTGGVEQSFLIRERIGAGDLVIVGSIDSPLTLQQSVPGSAALMLSLADGREVVSYGAAIAIDANGRRFPVTSRGEGSTITLQLAAAHVEDAAYPLLIDPLVSNVLLETGAAVSGADVLHETLSPIGGGGRSWIVYWREVAANDNDLFVQRYATNFSGAPIATYDEITGWDSRSGQIALAAGSGHVVIAFATGPTGGGATSFIGVHRHLATDLNRRTELLIPVSAVGANDFAPDIGGRMDSGSEMLLVFRRDDDSNGVTNTDTSAVYAAVIDPAVVGNNIGIVPPFVLRNSVNRDQESPSVNQAASGPEWLVAFSAYDNTVANDDWDVNVVAVDATGSVSAALLTTEQSGSVHHKMAPDIAGADGRYLMSYTIRQFELPNPKPRGGRGSNVFSQRIDWDHVANTGSLPHSAVLLQNSATRSLLPAGLAFDHRSTSHWCAGIDDNNADVLGIYKLGYRGAVTEARNITVQAGRDIVGGGITFNGTRRNFPLAFGSNDGSAANNFLWVNTMEYDQVAVPAIYGLSCGSGTWDGVTELTDRQQVGAEGVLFQMQNAPAGSGFAFLMFSLASDSQPGITYGLPGCTILVNPSQQVASVLVLLAGGAGEFEIDFPENLSTATLFAQWFYHAPGAMPVELQTSEGLELEIGR